MIGFFCGLILMECTRVGNAGSNQKLMVCLVYCIPFSAGHARSYCILRIPEVCYFIMHLTLFSCFILGTTAQSNHSNRKHTKYVQR